MSSNKQECVKVAMRCRPLNKQEMADGRQVVIQISPSRGELIVKAPSGENEDKIFTFDNVFDWSSSQDNIYQDTAYPIVQSVIEGYNGTIFAYGQTGTGKTFTMEGIGYQELQGIIPRTFDHIFNVIGGTPDRNFLVRTSFLELYNEEVRDLLCKNFKNKLDLRENPDKGVYIKDLSNHIVQDAMTLRDKLIHGAKSRQIGETKMNRESSRSHSIFTVIVEGSHFNEDGSQHITVGKLNLVDLAGSERQSKTGAVGDRFKEAISINQSLTSLGNCISALVDGKSTHIPYRDSKLTRLLQDSLGGKQFQKGNTKTVMIANIGPADYNYDETLSTLRYASRAKNIKNKPKINEDPKDAMIRQFQDEITLLKQELAKKIGGTDIKGEEVIEVEQIIKVEDEEKLRQIEQKLNEEKKIFHQQMEAEREKIEKQKNLAVEDRKRLLKLIDEKEQKQMNLEENKKNLISKLKHMEEKLLQGSKLKQQAVNQEKELQRARLELEEKKQKERQNQQLRRLKEELALKQANQMDVEQKFNSIKEEIDIKTNKLNTLIEKIQETIQQKSEIQGKLQLQEYRLREKDILMDENRNLTRELKLLDLIIENFIPQDEVNLINQKLQYDQDQDEWFVKDDIPPNISKPESALGLRYPICEFSRMAISFGDLNPRYRYDNILQLDLDLPEQTTEEFDGQISQKLQETIHISLNENEDDLQQLQQEMKPNIFLQESKITEKKKLRPQSGIKK